MKNHELDSRRIGGRRVIPVTALKKALGLDA